MCISKFTDIDEVVKRANATPYGLGAGICTNNIKEALKVTSALEAGSVYVNCFEAVMIPTPFGGWLYLVASLLY